MGSQSLVSSSGKLKVQVAELSGFQLYPVGLRDPCRAVKFL